jgi:hypothetical protein
LLIEITAGFGAAVASKSIEAGWQRIFEINYFVGLLIGFFSFILVNRVFPPEGLGIYEPFGDDLLESETSSNKGNAQEDLSEKGASVTAAVSV